LDRIERVHAVLIEAQRNLFRALKVLLDVQGTPEYRTAALRRITAAIPSLTEEERKTAEEEATKRLEENKARFACMEKDYDGPAPTEHH
jgi:translation initiation factor 2 alpha subunit (eIF-2alpha)